MSSPREPDTPLTSWQTTIPPLRPPSQDDTTPRHHQLSLETTNIAVPPKISPTPQDSPGWSAWREKRRQDREHFRASPEAAWSSIKRSTSIQSLRSRALTAVHHPLNLPKDTQDIGSVDQLGLILAGRSLSGSSTTLES